MSEEPECSTVSIPKEGKAYMYMQTLRDESFKAKTGACESVQPTAISWPKSVEMGLDT